MFHLSKSIRRSSRVFRETKRTEGRPARPSIHRAIRRGARGERLLMIQPEFAASAWIAAPHSNQPADRRTSNQRTSTEARSAGQECVRKCRSPWSTYNYTKNKIDKQYK